MFKNERLVISAMKSLKSLKVITHCRHSFLERLIPSLAKETIPLDWIDLTSSIVISLEPYCFLSCENVLIILFTPFTLRVALNLELLFSVADA
jgi:hypothetical protein